MKIKDSLTEELRNEYIRAFRAGYVAGFGNTGEGYNAEYPFYDNFENEEAFERSYKEALEQYIEDDE